MIIEVKKFIKNNKLVSLLIGIVIILILYKIYNHYYNSNIEAMADPITDFENTYIGDNRRVNFKYYKKINDKIIPFYLTLMKPDKCSNKFDVVQGCTMGYLAVLMSESRISELCQYYYTNKCKPPQDQISNANYCKDQSLKTCMSGTLRKFNHDFVIEKPKNIKNQVDDEGQRKYILYSQEVGEINSFGKDIRYILNQHTFLRNKDSKPYVCFNLEFSEEEPYIANLLLSQESGKPLTAIIQFKKITKDDKGNVMKDNKGFNIYKKVYIGECEQSENCKTGTEEIQRACLTDDLTKAIKFEVILS